MSQKSLLMLSVFLAAVLVGLIAVFGNTVADIRAVTEKVHHNGASVADRSHFVFIVEEYGHPYWEMVATGAIDAAAKHNVLLEVVGPIRSNIPEHKKWLEKAVAAQVDGIITQGLDDVAETPVINRAISQGIPVITVDTDAAKSNRISYVGTDNYGSGMQLARHIIAHSSTPQTIGLISGAEGATNQRERVEGFLHILKEYPDFHVVASGFSNISRLKASQEAEQLLKEHPGITMMVGTSGLDALGIYDAAKRLHRTDIAIYGYDDIPETLELIRLGHVQASVVQKPYTMGFRAVELMVDYRNKKQILPVIYTGTKIIVKEDMVR
jgi:ribose transport system substrate-binding protein